MQQTLLIVHILLSISAIVAVGISAYAYENQTVRSTARYLLVSMVASGVLLIVAGGSIVRACASGLLVGAIAISVSLLSKKYSREIQS